MNREIDQINKYTSAINRLSLKLEKKIVQPKPQRYRARKETPTEKELQAKIDQISAYNVAINNEIDFLRKVYVYAKALTDKKETVWHFSSDPIQDYERALKEGFTSSCEY